ncbi:hypothetical protein IW262DRAFT_1374227 [Armillaria fumosa]|nr:hypothetical protein IW262DRAFT_1374227 [Armillaria fumosa]
MSSPTLVSDSTTLADLPNELVFIILDELDLEQIMLVACLCRRLNYVALSYHIHRSMEPNKTTITSESASCTTLLRSLSLTNSELNSLSFGAFGTHCDLPFSSFKAIRLWLVTCPPVKNVACKFSEIFAPEAEQVARYFRTCPGLDQITLNFPPIYLRRSEQYAEREKQRHWAALEKLLHSLERVVAPKPHRIAGLFHPSLTLMGRMDIEEDGSAFDGPLLKNFRMIYLSDAKFLFCPSFRYWTIASLNTCCITSLHLDDVDIGPFLDLVQMDSLQRLMIQRCPRLLHSDLIPFLSRHASITELEASLLGPAGNTAFISESLSNLTRVAGPMDFLLVGLALPSVMANVAEVVVNYSSLTPSIEDTQRLLSFVADRPSITSLSIPLHQLNSTGDWLDYTGTRYESQVVHLTRLWVNAITFRFDEETSRRMVDAVSLFPQVDEFGMWGAMTGTEWKKGFCLKARETCHGLRAVSFDGRKTLLHQDSTLISHNDLF